MTRHIGIVGAGIAGLHLALYLQKHGVDAGRVRIEETEKTVSMTLSSRRLEAPDRSA